MDNLNFPLYDNLSKQVKKKSDLTASQKKELIDNISKFDNNGLGLIFALIKVYQLKNDKKDILDLPYNGKKLKDGLQFDLDVFPNKLKQILYKFSQVHLLKMEEEKNNVRPKN